MFQNQGDKDFQFNMNIFFMEAWNIDWDSQNLHIFWFSLKILFDKNR